jgi:hypothetical protein
MIITLKGADFSASNIGTLSSWRITRSLGSGATYEGPTSVDKGAAFTATVTLAEGYEIGTAGVTVTMGGTVLSGAHSISGNVITITIASVTGNVLIKVPTINTSEEPETPTNYTFTINPTPADAVVTLTALGYTQNGNSITVANGTTVNWSVSADGYTTRTGTWTANGENKTESIVLVATSGGEDEDVLTPVSTVSGYYIESNMSNTSMDAYAINKYDVSNYNTVSVSARIGEVAFLAWVDASGNRTKAGQGNNGAEINFNEILTVPETAVYLEVSYVTTKGCTVTKVSNVTDPEENMVEITSVSTTDGYYIGSNMTNTSMDAYAINKYDVSNYNTVSVSARIGKVAYLAWIDTSGKRTSAGNGNGNTGVNYNEILTVPETASYLEVSYSKSQPCIVKAA